MLGSAQCGTVVGLAHGGGAQQVLHRPGRRRLREPFTRGPGAHSHDEDDVFFVLEGTMSFFVGGAWIDAPKGSLVIAPGGSAHDFENRTAERAGALNVSVPGDFEQHMEGVAGWFRARTAAASRTANAPSDGAPSTARSSDP